MDDRMYETDQRVGGTASARVQNLAEGVGLGVASPGGAGNNGVGSREDRCSGREE